MAATYQSVSTTSWDDVTSGNSLTITKPTGLAAGNLLIAHLSAVRTGTPNADGWDTPSGWTSLISTSSSVNSNSSSGMTVFYKIADSSDAAASNFSFVKNGNNSTRVIGSLYRISGGSTVTGNSAIANANATPTFTNTVTPSADSLLLFLTTVSEPSPVSGSVSGYAITTSNPSWTEVYDSVSVVTNGGLHAGAYASRPEATATGDSTCTYVTTYQNSIGAIVAIAPQIDVTVTGSTGNLTLTGNAGSVTGSATITGATGVLTLTGNAGTHSSPTPAWDTQDKSSVGTWTNQSKS